MKVDVWSLKCLNYCKMWASAYQRIMNSVSVICLQPVYVSTEERERQRLEDLQKQDEVRQAERERKVEEKKEKKARKREERIKKKQQVEHKVHVSVCIHCA